MFVGLLHFGRRVPTLLEPKPLRRIFADNLFKNCRHAFGEAQQVGVGVARVLEVHRLADFNQMSAVGLTNYERGHNRCVEPARKNCRTHRRRRGLAQKLYERSAGSCVLVGKEAQNFSVFERTAGSSQFVGAAVENLDVNRRPQVVQCPRIFGVRLQFGYRGDGHVVKRERGGQPFPRADVTRQHNHAVTFVECRTHSLKVVNRHEL